MLRPLAVLATACLVTGCSGSSPTPTAPTSTAAVQQTVSPPSAMMLRGYVMDTASRPLAGAKVEAIDGPGAGSSAVADASGQVDISGPFTETTRFRASSDGHESIAQPWNCSVASCPGPTNARPWLLFQLRPLASPIDLSGEYTMTMTADASCSALPSESRTRTYRATLRPRTRTGTVDVVGFDVVLHSEAVLESLRRLAFGVAGDYVRIVIAAGHGDEPALVEHLGDSRYVTFTGWSDATLNRASLSTIDLRFDGSVDVVALKTPLTASYAFAPGDLISQDHCASTTHRMVFRRTGR